MAFHVAARFHAFVNGLLRPGDAAETQALYHRVERLLTQYELADNTGRAAFVIALANEISDALDLPSGHRQRDLVTEFVAHMLDYERLFRLPDIDVWEERTVAEHFALRAQFLEQRKVLEDFEASRTCLGNSLYACLAPIYATAPSLVEDEVDEDDLTFRTPMPGCLPHAGDMVEEMMAPFFGADMAETLVFPHLRDRLNRNLIAASGGNPAEPDQFRRSVTLPGASPIKDPDELCETYLSGTPLLPFLYQETVFSLSQAIRFEHTHILGGTGHGKTQLLQYMIHHDLERAEEGGLSVVVIDSQSDMIRKLSRLDLFTGSLRNRLVIIDPADIEHPPALNLFDAGLDRLKSYTPHQRELAFNSLVDIYGRFFGSLLGAELTAKQGAVFRYLARLMLTIEGATIHTLIELMDNPAPFKGHIQKLDPTARRFFEQEFSKGGFRATRQQITQRLYTVLSIPTFDRLFSAPRSKVNFFEVLNAGSVVLVNTAKDLLKTDGAAIFGRFILSLIEHAIMERATLREADRTPTFLYVDEAQDYFDETIETLLVQGRKQRFGLIMAHQNLAQTSTRLNAVLAANTTIKLVGGVSDRDARVLASDMRTTADMLLSMQKHADRTEFALSVRNRTAHALKTDIPLGFLEAEEIMGAEDYADLCARNRERVCYVPEAPATEPSAPEPATVAPVSPDVAPKAPEAGHRALQEQIATQARKHGFAASVEYLLPNDKRIDVALFGHGLRIAIEVSVTNRREYELSNIEKALEAGFTTVWMVAPDAEHRSRLEQFVRQKLAMQQWARVLFGTEGEVSVWLSRYKAPKQDASSVAGYTVEISFIPPQAAQEQQYRREQLRQALRPR